MSAAKTIQNPEIPGMERILPPPPPPEEPPPDPPLDTKPEIFTDIKPDIFADIKPDIFADIKPVVNPIQNMSINPISTAIPMAAPMPYPPAPTPAAYYPVAPVQPPAQTNTPWWVATDLDTSDAYQNWYEARYKAALAAQTDVTKIKHKSFKRKAEVVDPKLDAEKVASAQRELSALMKPLKCDLCNAVMNSTVQAKLHYQGKPHQKKVSMFLNQSAKKIKTDDGQVSSTTENDWNTYCDICKTWFTSQIDATQHYAGKKHMKAAHGVNKGRPTKKCPNSNVPVDPTGRFGIGISFLADKPVIPSPIAIAEVLSPPQPPPVIVSPVAVPPVVVPPVAVTPAVAYPSVPTFNAANTLRCDLCGVSTNRPDQLEIHKRGARHLRMLKLNGMPLPETSTDKDSTPLASGPIDYSIYRTPSGQYYCAPCNLSLNSEATFAQHIESKKHKNQTNPKVQSGSAGTKKAGLKKK